MKWSAQTGRLVLFMAQNTTAAYLGWSTKNVEYLLKFNVIAQLIIVAGVYLDPRSKFNVISSRTSPDKPQAINHAGLPLKKRAYIAMGHTDFLAFSTHNSTC